jgi:hypothetical protein
MAAKKCVHFLARNVFPAFYICSNTDYSRIERFLQLLLAFFDELRIKGTEKMSRLAQKRQQKDYDFSEKT